MKVTNKQSLPLNVALFQPRKPDPKKLHVTEMIDSPQILRLKTDHWDEMEEDVADMLYKMEGQVVHSIMEKHAEEGAIVEEGMHIMVGDVMVTGTPDKYLEQVGVSEEGEVTDWKGTSVWAYVKSKSEGGSGAKQTHINQLNVYAFFFRKLGKPVTKLSIWFKFRDWTPSEKARSGPDYPPCAFAKVEIPLWTEAEQLAYIQNRVMAHKRCQAAKEACSCSSEERWEKPTTYAVMKKGRKSALAVFGKGTQRGGGRQEAMDFAGDTPGPVTVEDRPGSFVRCELYCEVAKFCPQLEAEKQAKSDSAEQLAYIQNQVMASETEDPLPF